MKALAIRQPWAWLIVYGFKDIENRDWRTKYRGPFLVHASKTVDEEAWRRIRRERPDIPMPPLSSMDRGGIVGRAVLSDCVDESDSPWFTGPRGFLLREATPLPFEPYRGMPGFFDIEVTP